MPRESVTPGSPSDWLRRARSDLALAKMPLPDGTLYEDLCFHAQQAAEKAIKSVYRSQGCEFRYTHDETRPWRSAGKVPASDMSSLVTCAEGRKTISHQPHALHTTTLALTLSPLRLCVAARG